MVSLPDYDIAGRQLVWQIDLIDRFRRISGSSPTPPTAALRQFRRNRVPFRVEAAHPFANGRLAGPVVRIERRARSRQTLPGLGGSCPPRDSGGQLRIPVPQPSRLGCAKRPAQQGLVGGKDRGRLTFPRWPLFAAPGFPGSARLRGRLAAPATLPLFLPREPGRPRRRHGFAQQADPVEGEIGVGVLEGFAHLGIERRPPDLHV